MALINLTPGAERARRFADWERVRNHLKKREQFAAREPIAPTDLAYAAGIIDGEGAISITRRLNRRTYRSILSVSMCEIDAVEFLYRTFGGSIMRDNILHKDRPEHRPQSKWSISANEAAWCCERIAPFLRVKKRQALNLIELQDLNRKIREETTEQRKERRGQFGPARKGEFKTDPVKLARCAELYESQKKLNQRGQKTSASIKPTAPNASQGARFPMENPEPGSAD